MSRSEVKLQHSVVQVQPTDPDIGDLYFCAWPVDLQEKQNSSQPRLDVAMMVWDKTR